MKHFLLLVTVIIVVACGGPKDSENQEIVIERVPYDERTVVLQPSSAFTSCPPQHRQAGRC